MVIISRSGGMSKKMFFSLCIAFRSHVRPLTHTPPPHITPHHTRHHFYRYKEAGDEIDCTKMGIGGKAIPPYIDKITYIRSDAQFIILVEKEAAYMRLAEDRFYNQYPCIVITGKGQPDVATRM